MTTLLLHLFEMSRTRGFAIQADAGLAVLAEAPLARVVRFASFGRSRPVMWAT
ncbi:MAG: hypothetical protein WCB58_12470 [Acidobacteriaceae bacterium]